MSRPQINILIATLLVIGVIFTLANCSSSIIANPDLSGFSVDVEALPIDSISKADSVMAITYADFQECVNKFVDAKAESLNQLIVMWLSIIAAICTLLPMASSIYQAWQSDKIESKFRTDLDNIKNEIASERNDNEKRQEEIIIKNTLSLFEIATRSLCSMFHLGSIENLKLSDINHIRILLDILNAMSEQIMEMQQKTDGGNNSKSNRIEPHIKDKQKELHTRLGCCILANNSISELVNALECTLDGENLIKLLQIKDTIFLHTQEMEKLYSGSNEQPSTSELQELQVNKGFVEVHNSIDIIIGLIRSELNKSGKK